MAFKYVPRADPRALLALQAALKHPAFVSWHIGPTSSQLRARLAGEPAILPAIEVLGDYWGELDSLVQDYLLGCLLGTCAHAYATFRAFFECELESIDQYSRPTALLLLSGVKDRTWDPRTVAMATIGQAIDLVPQLKDSIEILAGRCSATTFVTPVLELLLGYKPSLNRAAKDMMLALLTGVGIDDASAELIIQTHILPVGFQLASMDQASAKATLEMFLEDLAHDSQGAREGGGPSTIVTFSWHSNGAAPVPYPAHVSGLLEHALLTGQRIAHSNFWSIAAKDERLLAFDLNQMQATQMNGAPTQRTCDIAREICLNPLEALPWKSVRGGPGKAHDFQPIDYVVVDSGLLVDHARALLPERDVHRVECFCSPDHAAAWLQVLDKARARYDHVEVRPFLHGTDSRKVAVSIVEQGLKSTALPGHSCVHGVVHGRGIYGDLSSFDACRGTHHKYGLKLGGSFIGLVILCWDGPDEMPLGRQQSLPVSRVESRGEWVLATDAAHMLLGGFVHHTETGEPPDFKLALMDEVARSTGMREMPMDAAGQYHKLTLDPQRLVDYPVGSLLLPTANLASLPPSQLGPAPHRPRLTPHLSWDDDNLGCATSSATVKDSAPAEHSVPVKRSTPAADDSSDSDEETPGDAPNPPAKRSRLDPETRLYQAWQARVRRAVAARNPLPTAYQQTDPLARNRSGQLFSDAAASYLDEKRQEFHRKWINWFA